MTPFKRLKSYFNLMGQRMGVGHGVPLRGSDDYILHKIAAYETIFFGGMLGGAQMMSVLFDPPALLCQAYAAKAILSHQACVTANRQMGRQYDGSYWLDKAEFWRAKALEEGRRLA